MRAARRIAQMNAARRVREAERVAIFWALVEEQRLTLEQLTTRVRRTLMSQAMFLQRWLDDKDAQARAETTTDPGPEGSMPDNSPSLLHAGHAPTGSRAARTARALRARGPAGP